LKGPYDAVAEEIQSESDTDEEDDKQNGEETD